MPESTPSLDELLEQLLRHFETTHQVTVSVSRPIFSLADDGALTLALPQKLAITPLPQEDHAPVTDESTAKH